MRQYSRYDKQWVVRAVVLALFDVVFVAVSYFIALMLRFDFIFSHIDANYITGYRRLIIPYCICVVVIFYIFRLYHSIWRFASVSELERMVLAWATFQLVVLVIYFITKIRMPMSFWAGGAIIGFLLTTSIRFSYRFLRGVRGSLEQRQGSVTGNERVMVIGAGESGRSIIHEYIMSRYLNARVCCVIDDNPVKKGRYLDGVPIEGGRQEIRRCVEEYQITTIIFAIPAASGIEKKEILDICGQTGCNPGIRRPSPLPWPEHIRSGTRPTRHPPVIPRYVPEAFPPEPEAASCAYPGVRSAIPRHCRHRSAVSSHC